MIKTLRPGLHKEGIIGNFFVVEFVSYICRGLLF